MGHTPAVGLHGGAFWIGEQPTFLYGGELHYFRLAPERWAERIAQAKALNLNTIASYIPWIWHEPTPGAFDFAGHSHPARDLTRFLRLVADAGLFFLARVGPVSNAELVGEGIPPWLFTNEPELQLRRADGTYLTGMPSYRHPGFLARVAAFYEALGPVLSPYLAGNGGNVPLVQLCNEIDMPTWLGKEPDHHAHVAAAYAAFTADPGALQPAGLVATWPSPTHTSWMDFYAAHFAGYAADLHARLPQADRTPVLVNLAQWTDHYDRGRGICVPMTTMMFRDMARAVPGMVLGGDYYPRRVDYENFHDVVIATEVVRMISAPGVPVVSPELMAGGNEDRPRIYAADIALLLHTAAGHGLNGLNLYMLAGGRNPEGIGLFGEEHDWQAPIAADGTERSSCEPIAAFGAFLAAHRRYPASQKVLDTHVGFYAPYFQTEYLRGEEIERLENRRVTIFQDGLLRLLSLDNLAYDTIDLHRAQTLTTAGGLWVYTEDWMDAATQLQLAEAIAGGSRVAFYPGLPTLGDDGSPCTILVDQLGAPPLHEITRFVHFDGTTLPVHGPVQTFAARPGDEILATTDSTAPCVLWRPLGQGGALLIGYGMRHRFDRQVKLIESWAARLGVTPHVRLEPADVIGALRADGDSLYLHVVNYHDEARQVQGEVRVDGRTLPLEPFTLERRSARALVLTTPAG